MKKNIISYVIFCGFVSSAALCDDFKDLKNRLDKISGFHAHFSQKVTDKNGNLLQEGRGEVWVKRPRSFNWNTTYPNESTIISDGETLWFYTPLLNQVTVTLLQDVIENTPFMLIFCNHFNDWKKYFINKAGDNFTLTPKKNNRDLKKFIININQDGKIHHFILIDQTDKVNQYRIILQSTNMIDISKFIFSPPSGVLVDDQRNK